MAMIIGITRNFYVIIKFLYNIISEFFEPLFLFWGCKKKPLDQYISTNGPVAQRLEQGTHNPLVLGSNPSGPTIIGYFLSILFFLMSSAQLVL